MKPQQIERYAVHKKNGYIRHITVRGRDALDVGDKIHRIVRKFPNVEKVERLYETLTFKEFLDANNRK